MMEDELIKIWQSSPEIEQIKFEKSRLIIDMQSSLDRLHKFLKYSILIDQISTLTIVPVFLFYIYIVPPLLSKIVSFFTAIWGVWYFIRLRNMNRNKPSCVTATYLDYLKNNGSYLRHLRDTGERTIYWDIILLLLGFCLFILGFWIDDMIDYKFLIKLILLGIGGLIIAYFYTRWLRKKLYVKRLKKIDELIKVMESQN